MSLPSTEPVYQFDLDTARGLLRTMLMSREGDLREQSLIRQGKGWFHIAAMGHEGMAALALSMRPDDYTFPYYRDRAFVLQRGLSTMDIAHIFYAKRAASSGGRQLPGHFSKRSLNIWSHPSPVGAHLLPACGAAWGMQLDRKDSIAFASLGEAATRQGEFYEAVCFAKERKLPVLFVVEDNRIAISTATDKTNPLALGVLAESEWERVDGTDVFAMAAAGERAIAKMREGGGPAFLWCSVERFHNHSSADDQRMYRDADELTSLQKRDPLERFKKALIDDGMMSAEAIEALAGEVKAEVRADYQRAGKAEDPRAEELDTHMYGPLPEPVRPPVDLGGESRILDAVNKTFRAAVDQKQDVVFFGEDIADPKGGVFNLTKGLSTAAPDRVVNSPLAEGTIMGVSVGLASYGKRPCFEIQFVDFIHPGWNQLVTNMSTLRWRSFGDWKCPLVIYAPCGGYLPGGALWHSQSGEGGFAHIPGLRVVVPGTPEDAAGLFWAALHGSDPTLVLLPKHLMWANQKIPEVCEPITLGTARRVREGDALTLVAWGNCLELVEEELEARGDKLSVDFIDLRSIAPWDRKMVEASVLKTGRLIVVQEDNISCSVGQMIIAELSGEQAVLEALKSPPVLVSKADVHVGFNPVYEYAALPDAARVSAAIDRVLSIGLEKRLEAAGAPAAPSLTTPETSVEPSSDETALTEPVAEDDLKVVTVPILGEGIRNARIVTVHKKVGDWVKADDPLCEVETDKAVFPIEVDEDGLLVEWKVADDAEVSVGEAIVVLSRSGKMPGASTAAAPLSVKAAPVSETAAPQDYESQKRRAGLSREAVQQLQGIVPATIEVTARWEAVRDARLRSKKTPGGTLSTAAISAWAVLEAMRKHERFASVVRGDELVYDPEHFDLGVAVALQGDALETAVVKEANKLDWEAFPEAFNLALRRVRDGNVDRKNRVPISISSMGPYNVRSAIPIVVPPSIATLFIGSPHRLPDPKKEGAYQEVVALVLTFDHRWVNGVGAASFLADVRKGIERFDLV